MSPRIVNLLSILVLSFMGVVGAEEPKLELLLQLGHTDEVMGVAVSDDGKHVLTGSRDGSAILWEAGSGRKLQYFQGCDVRPRPDPANDKNPLGLKIFHVGELTGVALTADGKQVVTASRGRQYGFSKRGPFASAIGWDAVSGKRLREMTAFVLSRNGKYVVTGDSDNQGSTNKTATLWEAASGNQIQTFKADGSPVPTVFEKSGGNNVITVKQNFLELPLGSVDVSGDGKMIAFGGNRTAILLDVATGKPLRQFPSRSVTSVFLSEDGKFLATLGKDSIVPAVLWDTDGTKPPLKFGSLPRVKAFEASPGITAMAMSRDARHFLTAHADQAFLWDRESGKMLQTLQGHRQPITSVAMSGDGKFAVTASRDRTVILWEPAAAKKLQTFQTQTAPPVTTVAVSGNGQRLVTSSDMTATLWAPAEGKILQLYRGHTGPITCAAISRDGNHIITGSEDKSAILWGPDNDKRIQILEGHLNPVTCVAISDEGKLVATGSEKAILWNATKADLHQTFDPFTKTYKVPYVRLLTSVSLSRDGKQLLTAQQDERVILWDTTTGKEIHRYRTGLGQNPKTDFNASDLFLHAAISRDGKEVAAAGSKHYTFKGTGMVWEISGKRVDGGRGYFGGHNYHHITSMAWSDDGVHIVTGSQDKTAILTILAKDHKSRTFIGHTNMVTGVALSGDAKHLWTASEDGSIRLWDPATAKEQCRLYTFEAGKDWLVVTPEGFFDGSEGARPLVAYRDPKTLKILNDDATRRRFHRPGLLARVWMGEK